MRTSTADSRGLSQQFTPKHRFRIQVSLVERVRETHAEEAKQLRGQLAEQQPMAKKDAMTAPAASLEERGAPSPGRADALAAVEQKIGAAEQKAAERAAAIKVAEVERRAADVAKVYEVKVARAERAVEKAEAEKELAVREAREEVETAAALKVAAAERSAETAKAEAATWAAEQIAMVEAAAAEKIRAVAQPMANQLATPDAAASEMAAASPSCATVPSQGVSANSAAAVQTVTTAEAVIQTDEGVREPEAVTTAEAVIQTDAISPPASASNSQAAQMSAKHEWETRHGQQGEASVYPPTSSLTGVPVVTENIQPATLSSEVAGPDVEPPPRPTLDMNFKMEGDVDSFDRTAFIDSLAELLKVEPSALKLRLSAGSVVADDHGNEA